MVTLYVLHATRLAFQQQPAIALYNGFSTFSDTAHVLHIAVHYHKITQVYSTIYPDIVEVSHDWPGSRRLNIINSPAIEVITWRLPVHRQTLFTREEPFPTHLTQVFVVTSDRVQLCSPPTESTSPASVDRAKQRETYNGLQSPNKTEPEHHQQQFEQALQANSLFLYLASFDLILSKS